MRMHLTKELRAMDYYKFRKKSLSIIYIYQLLGIYLSYIGVKSWISIPFQKLLAFFKELLFSNTEYLSPIQDINEQTERWKMMKIYLAILSPRMVGTGGSA